jgi:NTP pyrophosphatase (non-canonical NTP hydrolase)
MTLEEFQIWVDKRWNRKPRPQDLSIMTLGLGGEGAEVLAECTCLMIAIGRVSEPIKKVIRGDANPKGIENLIHELGDVQHYLVAIANTFGISMADVLKANVHKLEQREKDQTCPKP